MKTKLNIYFFLITNLFFYNTFSSCNSNKTYSFKFKLINNVDNEICEKYTNQNTAFFKSKKYILKILLLQYTDIQKFYNFIKQIIPKDEKKEFKELISNINNNSIEANIKIFKKFKTTKNFFDSLFQSRAAVTTDYNLYEFIEQIFKIKSIYNIDLKKYKFELTSKDNNKFKIDESLKKIKIETSYKGNPTYIKKNKKIKKENTEIIFNNNNNENNLNNINNKFTLLTLENFNNLNKNIFKEIESNKNNKAIKKTTIKNISKYKNAKKILKYNDLIIDIKPKFNDNVKFDDFNNQIAINDFPNNNNNNNNEFINYFNYEENNANEFLKINNENNQLDRYFNLNTKIFHTENQITEFYK